MTFGDSPSRRTCASIWGSTYPADGTPSTKPPTIPDIINAVNFLLRIGAATEQRPHTSKRRSWPSPILTPTCPGEFSMDTRGMIVRRRRHERPFRGVGRLQPARAPRVFTPKATTGTQQRQRGQQQQRSGRRSGAGNSTASGASSQLGGHLVVVQRLERREPAASMPASPASSTRVGSRQ